MTTVGIVLIGAVVGGLIGVVISLLIAGLHEK